MIKRSELIIRLERLRENAFFLISSGQSLERQAAQMEEELRAIMEELGQPASEPQIQEPPAEANPANPSPVRPTNEHVAPGLAVEFSGDPVAPSLATLVTPKQLGMIRALAREAGVDYEAECLEQFGGVKVDELGKRAASAFIDYLKRLQERGAEFRKAV